MLIGFSGVQSVGKTTLLEQLKGNKELSKRFTFVEEIVRNIKKEGYLINEEGNDYTQLRIIYAHIQNIYDKGDKILDRCLVDGYCYTIYLYRHHKVSGKIYRLIKNLFSTYVSAYNLIFYIEPEFKVVRDGIRSENEQFRDEMSNIFKKVINKIKSKIEVVKLSGTVENRIYTIERELHRRGIQC